jgi:hypothetical protein
VSGFHYTVCSGQARNAQRGIVLGQSAQGQPCFYGQNSHGQPGGT